MAETIDGDGGKRPLAERLAARIVALRWVWIVLTVVLAGVFAGGLQHLRFEPDARVFFAEENPDRVALDAFEAQFAKDDNLMIVLAPKSGDVFTPETLSFIGEITESAWLLPFVRRVDSLTNFQHTYANGDEMIVRDLIPDPPAVTAEEAAWARETALDRVELVNAMVNPEATVTMVQVMFRLPGENTETEVPSIVAEAEELRAVWAAAHPEVDVYLTGSVVINNAYATAGAEDGQNLLMPMFAVILAAVGLALRSAFGTLSVFIVIALSALAGMGALGWSGQSINSVTVLAPLYILTLAVASAVHILTAVRQVMIDTPDRKEWARRALADHMGAIAVACVTTAIGFLSLNFSISPPFRELGNIVAVGVIAALFFTLTLLPALITFLPIKRREDRAGASKLMDGIAEFVIANRKIILPGMAALTILGALGITQLKLEDDFVRYFDDRYAFRVDSDFTEDHLTGLNAIEYPLETGISGGINNPDYLKAVDGFANWLREQPEVGSVRALTDTIARLNMNMHADDPGFHRLPDTEEEASQFLFLYELSLGYGMDLTDRINVDRSALRVSVALPNVTTAEIKDLEDRALTWLGENAPGVTTRPTGVSHVFTLISVRDVPAMLTGTFIAVILISAVIMLALRNVRIGFISLIPNLLPAAVAFGLWGYGVGAVTLAISVVVAATLGIVVDDTVHFLAKYSKARREGRSPEDSVRYAFRSVGMALFVTTIGLVAGFGVLAQSGFAVNGDMAKLTVITITIALVADFLLLPALLIWLDRRKDAMTETTHPEGGAKAAPATALGVLALTAALGVALTAGVAAAETPEEKGLAISQEADRRDLGYGDFRAKGEMVLKDAGGNESRRAFDNMVLERPDPAFGDKNVIVFTAPRDIRGTGLLTFDNIEPADDDQWLYLPAVKRVKRISSSNRTGKFVSSEFSYEDLGSNEVADYDYKWIRDEACPTDPSLNCFVVESYPRAPKSGYSKRIGWIDMQEYRLQQVEFYNRRGDHEKTLTFTGYQQYLGQYWRPDLMTMLNKQTGKSTDLVWTDYQFRSGLNERDFSEQRLPKMAR